METPSSCILKMGDRIRFITDPGIPGWTIETKGKIVDFWFKSHISWFVGISRDGVVGASYFPLDMWQKIFELEKDSMTDNWSEDLVLND